MKAISILLLPILVVGLSSKKMLAQTVRDTSEKNIIVDPILPSAEFPGGDGAFKKFVRSNIHPVQGANGKKVIISFIVEKNGGLSHFKVERSISPEADNEALRVLRLSPKWKPVVYNGQAENSMYTVPIVFPK